MSDESLAHALGAYHAGLEAEIALLHQLQALSAAQHDASAAQDLAGVHGASDERERLLAALVALEHEVKPLRLRVAEHRQAAARLPVFAEVAARHRYAADLVTLIMASDRATLAALREAERARRFAAQAIEAGENTLAAYRRVVAPRVASASLLDEHG